MYLLPWQRFTLITPLSVPDVQARIAENLEPRKFWRLTFPGFKPAKPYEGEVSAGGFKIARIIGYRNSFLPIVLGTFSSEMGKTKVVVTMRMHHAVNGFLAVWYAFLLNFLFTTRSVALPLAKAGSLFLLVFLYLLSLIGFHTEGSKAKRFLSQLLEGMIKKEG